MRCNRLSSFVRRSKGRAAIGASVLLVAGALTACGGTPTESTASGDDVSGSMSFEDRVSASWSDLEGVYGEVDGLTGEERKAKLLELAEEEGGTVTWYTAINQDDARALVEKFTDDTGIEVELYSASGDEVIQRVQQEADSGVIRSDLLTLTGPDPTRASDNNYLAQEIRTPLAEELTEGAVHEDWLGTMQYEYVVSWNTDLVPEDQAPTSFEQVFTDFRDGNLAFTVGDFDWLWGMVQILTEDEGMTEDEAIDLLKKAAQGGVPVADHSLTAELMAAGQYKADATTYLYKVQDLQNEGAPIGWNPDLPVMTTFQATAISSTAENPAGALLMLEFLLTDGQEALKEQFRTPTNVNYPGGANSLDVELDTRPVDYAAVLADIDKWQGLYEEMLQSSGKDPIEEEG